MNRRLQLMLLYLLALGVAVPAINWLTNPFGAWREAAEKEVVFDANLVRVTTPYRLRTEQPTTVLVGSSRVLWGMPIENAYRDGVFNAALPGASLDEVTSIIRLALTNPRLKRVVWGVEYYAFDEKFVGFRDDPTRVRLEGDRRRLITETLLSTEACAASWRRIVRGLDPRKRAQAEPLPVPWSEGAIFDAVRNGDKPNLALTDPDAIRQQLSAWVSTYSTYRYSERQIALFRDTVAGIRDAGVELILFVPPFSMSELEALRQSGRWDIFQRWERDLAAVATYTDFAGYTELARSDRLFRDTCHFLPAVGHTILRHLLGSDCRRCGDIDRLVVSAGSQVDAASIEHHLARREAERLAHTQEDARYATLVGEMVAATRK